MEPNPEPTALASEIDARALFEAKLAALTLKKSETDKVSGKGRGGFMTTRFFSRLPKRDVARRQLHATSGADPQPSPARQPDQPAGERTAIRVDARPPTSDEPAGSLSEGAVSTVPSSPEIEGSENTPNAVPAPFTRIQGVASNIVTNIAEDSRAAAIPHPAPPANPALPDATDRLELRSTLPSRDRSQTHTTPTPMTNDPQTGGHASAQLTLGFEITSLQLTPFFRLGSLQLKALSNVVSLGLISPGQVGDPLATGISFQIDRVDLNGDARLANLVLRPLGESHEVTALQPRMQVDSVAVNGDEKDAPISVTSPATAATAVQLIGTFKIAAMEFSPAFEIDTLRLEPVSNTVLLRVAPAFGPDAQVLPASFEFAEVRLDDDARIDGARLVPSRGTNV